MKPIFKTLKYALGIVLVASAAMAANIALRTGPVDVADLRSIINQVVLDVNAGVGGLLFSQVPTVATAAGTAEQFLSSYSLPPSYLARNGQSVRFRATFSYAANTNNRTPKIYFGTTVTKTGTVNATSGGSGWLECIVSRSGAATQTSTCLGADGVTPIVQTFPAGTEDLTTSIAIRASCTDGTSSASDCVLQNFIVESLQ